jgi:hypothetical protein
VPKGRLRFRNVSPSKYKIEALKLGFQQVTCTGIDVTLSATQRVEITLPVGTQEQRIEVVGGFSVLSTTETQEHGMPSRHFSSCL